MSSVAVIPPQQLSNTGLAINEDIYFSPYDSVVSQETCINPSASFYGSDLVHTSSGSSISTDTRMDQRFWSPAAHSESWSTSPPPGLGHHTLQSPSMGLSSPLMSGPASSASETLYNKGSRSPQQSRTSPSRSERMKHAGRTNSSRSISRSSISSRAQDSRSGDLTPEKRSEIEAAIREAINKGDKDECLRLFRERGESFRDIERYWPVIFGEQSTAGALRMRASRGKRARRDWEDSDTEFCRRALKEVMRNRFEFVSQEMRRLGCDKRWSAEECRRHWLDANPSLQDDGNDWAMADTWPSERTAY